MSRVLFDYDAYTDSFPRLRGDEPPNLPPIRGRKKFSPPTRG